MLEVYTQLDIYINMDCELKILHLTNLDIGINYLHSQLEINLIRAEREQLFLLRVMGHLLQVKA